MQSTRVSISKNDMEDFHAVSIHLSYQTCSISEKVNAMEPYYIVFIY